MSGERVGPMKIATVVGARPQFIKAAMLRRAIDAAGAGVAREVLIHTGQHFDANMSDVFFEELAIPRPDHHLGVREARPGRMLGRMIAELEPVLLDEAPDYVVVYGDTNSTLAGALAAAMQNIPVAHVEAGMRSFDRRMPEEKNRVFTDHASSILFAPSETAVSNLRDEGIDDDRIELVGDIMYDAILHFRPAARRRLDGLLERLGLRAGRFVLATVHRAGNTDDDRRLADIVTGLGRVAARLTVVIPLHPRTRGALQRAGLMDEVQERLRVTDPLGYLDMLALQSAAAVVATDSGGLQKEAFFHGVPCVTLRDETEWVELVEVGANVLTGTDPDAIDHGVARAASTTVEPGELYGNGHAADAILNRLVAGRQAGSAISAINALSRAD